MQVGQCCVLRAAQHLVLTLQRAIFCVGFRHGANFRDIALKTKHNVECFEDVLHWKRCKDSDIEKLLC